MQLTATAPFHRAAGLADSSWTSLRSYNFPDRYIRHSSVVPRIDRLSATTAKQDATFRITF